MRRPTSVLAKAFLGTALAASSVSAQQAPTPSGAGDGAAALPLTSPDAPPLNPARGARHLLRNGWDYIAYQEYDRALSFFREAQRRQGELNDAERMKLREGLDRAQRGIREQAMGVKPGATYARSGMGRRPGALAVSAPTPKAAPAPVASVAPSPTPGDKLPRFEREPIQLAGGGSVNPTASNVRQLATTAEAAPAAAVAVDVTESAPPVSIPDTLPTPPETVPDPLIGAASAEAVVPAPAPAVDPAPTPIPAPAAAPEPSPIPLPNLVPPAAASAALAPLPVNAPSDEATRPAQATTAPTPIPMPTPVPATEVPAPIPAPVPAPSDSLELPPPAHEVPLPAPTESLPAPAVPARELPAAVPAPAPQPMPASEPLPAPAPAPTPIPMPTPPPRAADEEDLVPLPASLNERSSPAPAPAPLPESTPAPVPAPTVPTPLPTTPEPLAQPTATLPAPAPAPEPAPVAEPTAPRVALDTPPVVPNPAPAPAGTGTGVVEAPPAPPAEELLPPPGSEAVPVPVPTPAPAADVMATMPRPSTLTPELQRKVEEMAQRQEDALMRRPATPPVSNDPMVAPNIPGITTSRLELQRAPSPTEARPLKGIPVPEEFVPLPKREWDPNRKYWAAAATAHMPLYFQDAVLERYGYNAEQRLGPVGRYLSYPLDDPRQSKQRNQIVQPFMSIGLFLAQIAVLPYNMVVDPPWEAEYDLGYYRPGDRVPTDVVYLPWRGVGPPLRGANYGGPGPGNGYPTAFPAPATAPRW